MNSRIKVNISEIVDGIKAGDTRILSRTISIIENDYVESEEILKKIFPLATGDYRIGITGPPGAGKSTLVSKLVKCYRKQNKRIGIIAVDPTSPFSGGAVLGDRIRMSEVITDPGIFIRSMATRGSTGGLSRTAQEVADIMSASGMEIIIFETVGVGQVELDVARASDTTLVLLVPESGDSIQAMKAGLMEIADIFVINKADREGAEKLKIELETMLQLRVDKDGWNIPIIKTIANEEKGIEELIFEINEHLNFLNKTGTLKNKRYHRIINLIYNYVRQKLEQDFWNIDRINLLNDRIIDIMNHNLSIQDLVQELQNNEKI